MVIAIAAMQPVQSQHQITARETFPPGLLDRLCVMDLMDLTDFMDIMDNR